LGIITSRIFFREKPSANRPWRSPAFIFLQAFGIDFLSIVRSHLRTSCTTGLFHASHLTAVSNNIARASSYFTNFHQNKTTHYRHHGVSPTASLEHLELRHFSYTNDMLTPFAVKRRCTSTWSLSATLTPESRPPPAVSLPFRNDAGSQQLTLHTDLIYKCGGIDKRTIEKFEKVRIHFPSA
jgi:hypothetical protein